LGVEIASIPIVLKGIIGAHFLRLYTNLEIRGGRIAFRNEMLSRGHTDDRVSVTSDEYHERIEQRPVGWRRFLTPTAKEARHISYASMVFTVISATIGIVVAVNDFSASMLGLSLNSFLDVLSSVVIIWRFSNSLEESDMDLRENRATVLIGLSFILLGVLTFFAAVYHLVAKEPMENVGVILAIAIPSLLVLIAFGVLKVHMAAFLHSNALKEDAYSDFGSAITCIGIILSIAIYDEDNNIWWIDSVVALFISVSTIRFVSCLTHCDIY